MVAGIMDTTAIVIMAADIIMTATAAMDTGKTTTAGTIAGRVDARGLITTTGLPARMAVSMVVSEADALRVVAGQPVVIRAVQEEATHRVVEDRKEVIKVVQEVIAHRAAGPIVPAPEGVAGRGGTNVYNSLPRVYK
jgi:hypothetical protein